MVKGEERWFCRTIHVYTQSHGNILKAVSCLNSNLPETSCPVFSDTLCVFQVFQLLSDGWHSHEEMFYK